jgi:hypothetical protein
MMKKKENGVPTPKHIAKLVLHRDFATDDEALQYIKTHEAAATLVRDGLNKCKECDTSRGPLARPTGGLTMLEVAEIVFERPFRSATALTTFLDSKDRDFALSMGLSLAGWVPEEKRRDKIAIRTADALFRQFIAGVDAANANTKLAYFVEKITLFGSYLRRAQHVTDIDMCISYLRKTSAKLDQTIRRCARLNGVDSAEGYNLSLREMGKAVEGGSRFHFSDDGHIDRMGVEHQLIYLFPDLDVYSKLVAETEQRLGVRHLHKFLRDRERCGAGPWIRLDSVGPLRRVVGGNVVRSNGTRA